MTRPCLECGLPLWVGHDCYFFERLKIAGQLMRLPVPVIRWLALLCFILPGCSPHPHQSDWKTAQRPPVSQMPLYVPDVTVPLEEEPKRSVTSEPITATATLTGQEKVLDNDTHIIKNQKETEATTK